MALPRDASDAELAARAARGDHAAVEALWARYADAVHDHVARWSQDAAVAAAATTVAFTALLDDVATGTVPPAVLPSLLRAARSHVTAVFTAGTASGPAVAPAVLAASADPATAPDEAAAAWAAAVALGTPAFSVLDLTTRHGCDPAALAGVLALPTAAVDELVADVQARTDEPTRVAYGALATIPAPVAGRAAVLAAATALVGRPRVLASSVRPWLLALVAVAAGAVAAVGLTGVLRTETATPIAGTETAAAVPVASPSPSPSPTPSPTPTLDTLTSPAPSPTPEPSPSPSPTPPPPLTVTITAPTDGTAVDAAEDVEGQQVGFVPVAATVAGAGPDAVVAWTSDQSPGETLLAAASGDLTLWLATPCQDTTHVLTVTAADPASGQTATASVQVLLRATCGVPLDVTITQPAGGGEVATTATAAGTYLATIEVAAEATDPDVVWTWTADATTVQPTPDGPSGTIAVELPGCDVPVTVTADITRPADETTATASVTVQAACPAA